MILLMGNKPFEEKRITDPAFPRLKKKKKKKDEKQDLIDLASYLPSALTMRL